MTTIAAWSRAALRDSEVGRARSIAVSLGLSLGAWVSPAPWASCCSKRTTRCCKRVSSCCSASVEFGGEGSAIGLRSAQEADKRYQVKPNSSGLGSSHSYGSRNQLLVATHRFVDDCKASASAGLSGDPSPHCYEALLASIPKIYAIATA